jgi:hypothetical protein
VNRLLATAALLASLSLSSGASAAEGSPDKLIEQGLRLRRDGKPAEALELFRQAHAIAPSPRTFGQMGLVETSLREWVEGENHLAVSLANPDDAWVRKNRAFLDEALSLCREHVGDLVVSGPAGAAIFVGGRSVGTLPAVPALRLAEGTVTVTASAPAYQPFERTVTIQAGQRTMLAIALVPIAVPPPSPAAAAPITPTAAPPLVQAPVGSTEQPKRSSWHTWTGVSLMAAGAVALGWGITWIAIDGNCPPGTASQDCGMTVEQYNTRTGGWILAGIGTAAIAGGAAIFFTRDAPANSNIALRLTPTSLLFATRF